MKKVYFLITFICFFSFEIESQTLYTLARSVELKNYANGNKNEVRWSDATTTTWPNTGAPLVSGSKGTIVVPFGVTLTLSAPFSFNGTIKVEKGGAIVFNRDNPNDGQLIMDAQSLLILLEGSSISSAGSAGDQHNYLKIGDGVFYGDDINLLPKPPLQIDEGYAKCIASGVATCKPTPMPVNLLYFKATAQSSAVEINWASSKAWDFSHYELERSADGKAFEYVATIDAEEVTNSVVEYSYADRQPVSGTSYYRLKAVDIDGAFDYKNVALVKFGAEIFKVFPNPSNLGYINISWSHATEGATVSLKDNMGRSVRTTKLLSDNTTISTEGLTPGMYLLSVQGPAGIQQTQVLVQ